MAIGMVIATVVSSNAYDCSDATYEKAKMRVALLMTTQMISIEKGKATSPIVSEKYWLSLPYKQKQQLAEELVCILAGGGGKAIRELQIRSNMTNKTMATWTFSGWSGIQFQLQ
jgi:hypothetical protein